MKKIILTILASVAILACQPMVGSQQVSIENTKWVIIGNTHGMENIPTLSINGSEKVSGNAGCNNYFGQITLNKEKGEIKLNNIGVTMKACKNMQGEYSFLELIQKADHYQVKDNVLELYHQNLLLVKFKKAEK